MFTIVKLSTGEEMLLDTEDGRTWRYVDYVWIPVRVEQPKDDDDAKR